MSISSDSIEPSSQFPDVLEVTAFEANAKAINFVFEDSIAALYSA